MAYSHCRGLGQEQGTEPRLMGPNVLYRNVHAGPRQGEAQDPRPIVSYCASTVTWSRPVLV